MKLILTQEVSGLGSPGDVVEVGYLYATEALVLYQPSLHCLLMETMYNHLLMIRYLLINRSNRRIKCNQSIWIHLQSYCLRTTRNFH